MGLTTSALQIGRSALLSYQAALQLVGNNIANAGNSAYTRQSAGLDALPPPLGSRPQIGNGVQLGNVRRNISEALQERLRQGYADRQSADSATSVLTKLEAILNPLGDANLSRLMETFFKSLGDLQNHPEDLAARRIVVANGQQVAQQIRATRGDILASRDEANSEIDAAVGRADQLASQIAQINAQVVAAEANGGPATGLRDQRDELLRQLSEIVQITTREQPTGAVNVYIGNEPLVMFSNSRGLKTTLETGADGLLTSVVRFGSNDAPVPIQGGQLEGLIAGRDSYAGVQVQRLDQLATALIQEFNKLHAKGQGLSGFSNVSSTNPALDATAALNAAATGLALTPQTGTFYIDVKDAATGSVVRTQIHVDLDGVGSDSSLNSLAADINGSVSNVTATVQADGTLKLTATAGFSFTFADDTSNVLASLGINTFFSGSSSIDIDVASAVADSPDRIAAARSGLSGDGSNAGALAGLIEQGLASIGGASLADFHNASVSLVAVGGSAAQNALDASDAILTSLTAQRESISGVNLDEETIKLVSYQRAYEGAARYLTVVDELLQTLLNLVS